MSRQCSLYVIVTVVDGQSSAPIKIGIARSPRKRLADFQTASPNELKISLDVIYWSRQFASDVERACHAIARSAGFHRRGEWLNLDPSEASGLIGHALDIVCDRRPMSSHSAYQSAVHYQAGKFMRLTDWMATYVHVEPTEAAK